MNKLEVKTTMKLEEIISILEGLIGSMKKGTVYVKNGEGYVTLTPGPEVNVELEASQKSDKGKLSLKLGWSTPAEEEEAEKLSISDTEPVQQELPENNNGENPIIKEKEDFDYTPVS